jgi:hypothetical protein
MTDKKIQSNETQRLIALLKAACKGGDPTGALKCLHLIQVRIINDLRKELRNRNNDGKAKPRPTDKKIQTTGTHGMISMLETGCRNGDPLFALESLHVILARIVEDLHKE